MVPSRHWHKSGCTWHPWCFGTIPTRNDPKSTTPKGLKTTLWVGSWWWTSKWLVNWCKLMFIPLTLMLLIHTQIETMVWTGGNGNCWIPERDISSMWNNQVQSPNIFHMSFFGVHFHTISLTDSDCFLKMVDPQSTMVVSIGSHSHPWLGWFWGTLMT